VADDDGMTKPWRLAAGITGGVLLAAVAVAGVVTDLDRADKVASVIGAVAGVIALAVAVFAGAGAGGAAGPGQSVSDSQIGGNVNQVRDVGGDVDIG